MYYENIEIMLYKSNLFFQRDFFNLLKFKKFKFAIFASMYVCENNSRMKTFDKTFDKTFVKTFVKIFDETIDKTFD